MADIRKPLSRQTCFASRVVNMAKRQIVDETKIRSAEGD